MLSLGVTVLAMLVVVGATGLCSLNPETDNVAVREVDAAAFTELEARAHDYAVRMPQLPSEWVSNSARRAGIAGQPVTVVGWVTESEGFISAWQTAVSYDDAIKNFDGRYRDEKSEQVIEGMTVTIARSDERGVRDIWVTDLGDATLVLTGSTNEDDYRTLLAAFALAEPLPSTP